MFIFSWYILVTDISLPTIAIRVDFAEKAYTVAEGDEYLEVCIRLASTGYHKKLLSSVEITVTYDDQSTTGKINGSLIEGLYW